MVTFLPQPIKLSDSGPPPNANFYPVGKREYYQGEGSPEGVVLGDIGDDYTDLSNGDEWRKLSNQGFSTGWVNRSEALAVAGANALIKNTIADAQALTREQMAAAQIVVVLGLEAAYDGLAGGIYTYNSDGTDEDDGITHLRPVDFATYGSGILQKAF